MINVILNTASVIIHEEARRRLATMAAKDRTNDRSKTKIDAIAHESPTDSEEFTLAAEGIKLTFGGYAEVTGGFFSTPPLIRYTRVKKAVITDVGGEEVIEEVGMQAYEMSISGLLISNQHEGFPKDKIEKIKQLFEVNADIKIQGEIPMSLGIDMLYISELSINGEVGYADTWSYSLKARSVKPLTFLLQS